MKRTIIHASDIPVRTYPELVDGRCSGCGQLVTSGEWPMCPHGHPLGMLVRDEIPGGIVLENYGPEPITVYSHSERRRILRERGLQETERWAPLPGTDRDPQGIPNPNGYRDLSAAAIIARNGQRSADDPARMGGAAFDPTDTYDIPNDPSLVRDLPGAFNDVEVLTNAQARKLMESV